MSSLKALYIKMPALGADDIFAKGPRPADAVDAPVASPVHDLQVQLQRLNAAGSVEADPYDADLAPGWVRLTVPLGTSVALWAAILWATGTLRMVGLTD